jgi:dihydrodiol dehydrogenase / D-xylose 1-dehydrogenase (NADP)
MGKSIGWGLLGAGSIATKYATDLVNLPDARLVAVGSRSADKAARFAGEVGVERSYGSYADMIADPEVDVVYVATPHPFHKEHTLLCLEGGKAVLCEKPMAVHAGQAREMVAAARKRDLLLMEAMWSRFNPVLVQVRQWLSEGRIGEVRILTADFGFRTGWNPEGRLLNPALAGGALLDVGVYVVSLASLVFGGAPEQIQAAAHIGETGVDEQTGMVLKYPGGGLALLACAIRTVTPHLARIDGTEGAIEIPRFWHPTTARLIRPGQEPVEATGAFGYHYEAAEVMACLREGRTESAIMPLHESISIAETMDQIRTQIGLRYPADVLCPPEALH